MNAELSSTLAAAEKTGIPRKTIAYWLERPEFAELRQKTREDAAAGFGVLMHKAQDRLVELVPSMEARDLIVLLGVATDKAQLLSGQATQRTENRDLVEDLKDHEREALREAIDKELASRAAD